VEEKREVVVLDTNVEEEKYKEYCKSESNEAYVSICKNQEEYDKQLLALSTGMLAVLFFS
jgi:hypothetical protein